MNEQQEGDTGGGEQKGYISLYFDWLFKGNILVIALKFIWSGMWITALTTFQWVEAGVIIGIGIAIWFIANDYENWYIEWD